MNRSVIPTKWRIALALLFPLIFVIGILFGAVIFGTLIVILIAGALLSIFTGKRPKLPKFKRIKINIVRK